jgi:hypothetical protein
LVETIATSVDINNIAASDITNANIATTDRRSILSDIEVNIRHLPLRPAILYSYRQPIYSPSFLRIGFFGQQPTPYQRLRHITQHRLAAMILPPRAFNRRIAPRDTRGWIKLHREIESGMLAQEIDDLLLDWRKRFWITHGQKKRRILDRECASAAMEV